MEYNCIYCNYHTNVKANYNKHLLTEKHIQVSQKIIVSQVIPSFKCKYCDQTYKYRSSLSKHMKTCKNVESNFDIQLIKIELQEHKKQINEQKLQIEKIISEIF